MKKATLFFNLAVTMFLLSLTMAISGFVLWLAFPSGGGGGGHGRGGGDELTFWELSKHSWIDVHNWVAVALLSVAIIHIILHWKWIARMSKNIITQTAAQLRGAYPRPVVHTTNYLVSEAVMLTNTDSMPGRQS
ncbi:DUF4405 domain-containing protein [Bacteroidota bacterium]